MRRNVKEIVDYFEARLVTSKLLEENDHKFIRFWYNKKKFVFLCKSRERVNSFEPMEIFYRPLFIIKATRNGYRIRFKKLNIERFELSNNLFDFNRAISSINFKFLKTFDTLEFKTYDHLKYFIERYVWFIK